MGTTSDIEKKLKEANNGNQLQDAQEQLTELFKQYMQEKLLALGYSEFSELTDDQLDDDFKNKYAKKFDEFNDKQGKIHKEVYQAQIDTLIKEKQSLNETDPKNSEIDNKIKEAKDEMESGVHPLKKIYDKSKNAHKPKITKEKRRLHDSRVETALNNSAKYLSTSTKDKENIMNDSRMLAKRKWDPLMAVVEHICNNSSTEMRTVFIKDVVSYDAPVDNTTQIETNSRKLKSLGEKMESAKEAYDSADKAKDTLVTRRQKKS